MEIGDWERIHIFGGAGSGKTTLARRLAAHLGYPCIDLDGVAWGAAGKVGLRERKTAVFNILSQPSWIIEQHHNEGIGLIYMNARFVFLVLY